MSNINGNVAVNWKQGLHVLASSKARARMIRAVFADMFALRSAFDPDNCNASSSAKWMHCERSPIASRNSRLSAGAAAEDAAAVLWLVLSKSLSEPTSGCSADGAIPPLKLTISFNSLILT